MLLNRERAEVTMEKYDLDAVIATSPENVRYASDYGSQLPLVRRWAFQGFVVLPRVDVEPVLIVPYSALPYLAEHPSWIADVRAYGAAIEAREPDAVLSPAELKYNDLADSVKKGSSGLQLLIDTIKEKGLAGSRLGLDEAGLLMSQHSRLREELPEAALVDAFGIFREIRLVKTASEIEGLRHAVKVNELAMMDVIGMLGEGVTEKQMVACYDQSLAKNGGVPRLHQMGAGTRGSAFCAPSDYRMQKGDLIYLDPVCTVNGFWSDTSRQPVIGQPDRKQLEYYEAMRIGVEAGIEAVRPGIKASDIYHIIVDTIRSEGIPHLERSHAGHGIGLEMYELPQIRPADAPIDPFLPHITDVTLEENMVFNLEAPYYEFGFGTLQLEDTIRVTRTGCERLNTLSHDLFIC